MPAMMEAVRIPDHEKLQVSRFRDYRFCLSDHSSLHTVRFLLVLKRWRPILRRWIDPGIEILSFFQLLLDK